VRYVCVVAAVRSLIRNNIRWENVIKMSIKYWQNLAQNNCSVFSCKPGNERKIVHLPRIDISTASPINIIVEFRLYTSYSTIYP
jgi:hypothetical protein